MLKRFYGLFVFVTVVALCSGPRAEAQKGSGGHAGAPIAKGSPGSDAPLRAFQSEIELQVKEVLGLEPGERFDALHPCASIGKFKSREDVFLHPNHQYACTRLAAANYVREAARVMGIDFLEHKKKADVHTENDRIYKLWVRAACQEVWGKTVVDKTGERLCDMDRTRLKEMMTTDVQKTAYEVSPETTVPTPQQLRKRTELTKDFAYFDGLRDDLNYFDQFRKQTDWRKLVKSSGSDPEFRAFRNGIIGSLQSGKVIDRAIDAEHLRLRYVYQQRLLDFYLKSVGLHGLTAPEMADGKCGRLTHEECGIAHDWLLKLSQTLDKCERTPAKGDAPDPLDDDLIRPSVPHPAKQSGCITRDGFHNRMEELMRNYFSGFVPEGQEEKELQRVRAMAKLLYGQHRTLPPLLAPLQDKDRPVAPGDIPLEWAMHDWSRSKMGLSRAVELPSEKGPSAADVAAKLKSANRETRLAFIRSIAVQGGILFHNSYGKQARAIWASIAGLLNEWGYKTLDTDVREATRPIVDAMYRYRSSRDPFVKEFHDLSKQILEACKKAAGASAWARGVGVLEGDHAKMGKAIVAFHNQAVEFEKVAKDSPGMLLYEYTKTAKAAATLISAFENYVDRLNGHRYGGRMMLGGLISLMPGGGFFGAGFLIGYTADSPEGALKDATVFIATQLVGMGLARYLGGPLQSAFGVHLGKAATGVLAGGGAGATFVTTDSLLNKGTLPTGEQLLWGTGTGAFVGLVTSPLLPARTLNRPMTATEEAFFTRRGMLPASGPRPTLAQLYGRLDPLDKLRLGYQSPPIRAYQDGASGGSGYRPTWLSKMGTGVSLATLTLAGTQIVGTPDGKSTHDGGDVKEGDGATGVTVHEPPPPDAAKGVREKLAAVSGLPNYGGVFGEDVVQKIASLPKTGHWINSGPVDGQSTLDYFAVGKRAALDALKDTATAKAMDALTKRGVRDRGAVTVIASEAPKLPASGDAKLRVMVGDTFLENDSPYGKADIVTDVNGLFTRSNEPDVVLRRYFSHLKLGGTIYLSSAVLKTSTVTPKGKTDGAVSLLDWMKPEIKGIQIIDRTLPGSLVPALEIRLGQRVPIVPEIEFVSEDVATVPPTRRYRTP